MQKYILNQNELESLIRYEILYKYEQWRKKVSVEHESFANYLLTATPYGPKHELIQSFCKTKEEKENPTSTGIYKEFRPADIAKYQLKFYNKYNEK